MKPFLRLKGISLKELSFSKFFQTYQTNCKNRCNKGPNEIIGERNPAAVRDERRKVNES